MNDEKRSAISIVTVVLIFASSIVGLYAVNGLENPKSYADTTNSVNTNATLIENEFFRTFNEIDNTLLSFFDDLRKELGSSLFTLGYHNFM